MQVNIMFIHENRVNRRWQLWKLCHHTLNNMFPYTYI